MSGPRIAAAQPVAEPDNEPPRAATSTAFVLGPPKDDRPVVVRTSFDVREINEINEEKETFEFTGVLRLRWRDKRQAFDLGVFTQPGSKEMLRFTIRHVRFCAVRGRTTVQPANDAR